IQPLGTIRGDNMEELQRSDEMEVENTNEKLNNPFADFWRKFKKQKVAFAAGIFIVILVILAIIGPSIVPYDVTKANYQSVLEGPSLKHWAGTDESGRDIFSRIIVGTRISLSVGFFSVFIGAAISTFLGLIACFFGKKIDNIIMRACDVLFAFPGILLAIGIIAILGSGLVNVVYVFSFFTIPIFSRIARSSTIDVRYTVYVELSKSTRVSYALIIFKLIFPVTLSRIL